MSERRNKIARRAIRISGVAGALLVIFLVYFIAAIVIQEPEVRNRSVEKVVRLNPAADFYTVGNNWLKKSESGLWEMYVEGDGFERGVAIGKLTKELAEKQEMAFVKQIKLLVPSESYLKYLKYFVAYFNRNLPDHIPQEYLAEIYGVSLYASDKFDYIAPKYYRMLNYHAAHDIGHALADKNMTVGCTSFAAWNDKSANGKLIVGRNFDFYSGDEFAENKIVCFCNPTKGYKFAYITWAGFTGVVSGMNNQGLTVTINAAKSEIPTSAATPISIVAKEILQYAGNINEAMEIAKKRATFVSESILIASAKDDAAAIIEKTPSKTNLYTEKQDVLLCTNHYQSVMFKDDPDNNKNIEESSSMYREQRLRQLVERVNKMDYMQVAAILRDQGGMDDKNIGFTNEKAINQLLAHHSVIMEPVSKLMWVSTQPVQLGKFYCYGLDSVFSTAAGLKEKKEIYLADKTIPEDTFMQSQRYSSYLEYKKLKTYIQHSTNKNKGTIVDESIINKFVSSNPENYVTYWVVGDYYNSRKDRKAVLYYEMALNKEVATEKERKTITALVQQQKSRK